MKKVVVVSVIVIFGILFLAKTTQAKDLQAKNDKEREIMFCTDTKMVKFQKILDYLDEYYPDRTMEEELELIKKFEPAVIIDNGGCTIEVVPELVETTVTGKITHLVTGKLSKVEEKNPEEKEMMVVKEKNYSYVVLLLGDVMYIEAEEYINDENAEEVFKAVGSAALNRVYSNLFPNTLYEVIHQGEGTKRQQYAQGTLNKIGHAGTPDIVYQWAEELIENGPTAPKNMVFQANFKQGQGVWLHYGKLYFCISDQIEP